MKQTKQQTTLFDTGEKVAAVAEQKTETARSGDASNSKTARASAEKVSAPVAAAESKIKSHPRGAGKDGASPDRPKLSLSIEGKYSALVSGVQDYFKKAHFKQCVLGLSGGVDSALTLKIAVDALGAEQVTALLLPELGLTKEENIDHAKALCEYFGVHYFYQPINTFLTDFGTVPWKPNSLAAMNTKARVRAVLLYNFANTHRALVLGTSNKSELLLGYGTKFGDLAADVEVIGDLYKTEVIAMADQIGLPPEIVHKTPSAELAPGQTDEEEMGGSYADIDAVLTKLDDGIQECIAHGMSSALVHMVFRRVQENKHKTEQPYTIQTHEE